MGVPLVAVEGDVAGGTVVLLHAQVRALFGGAEGDVADFAGSGWASGRVENGDFEGCGG